VSETSKMLQDWRYKKPVSHLNDYGCCTLEALLEDWRVTLDSIAPVTAAAACSRSVESAAAATQAVVLTGSSSYAV
jgi:hypothetical protein